jgi:hypothetical protein
MDLFTSICRLIIAYTGFKTGNVINFLLIYVIYHYINNINKYLETKKDYNIKNPFLYSIKYIGSYLQYFNNKKYDIMVQCKKNYIYDYFETGYNKMNNYFNEFLDIVYDITNKNISYGINFTLKTAIDEKKPNQVNLNKFNDMMTDMMSNMVNKKNKKLDNLDKIMQDIDILEKKLETNYIYDSDDDKEFISIN